MKHMQLTFITFVIGITQLLAQEVWKHRLPKAPNVDIDKVIIDDDGIWGLGVQPYVLSTQDTFRTINFVDVVPSRKSGLVVNDLVKIEKETYVLCGLDSVIYYSNDAAKTWTTSKVAFIARRSPAILDLTKLFFLNESIGFAVGNDYDTAYHNWQKNPQSVGIILKTTNGGKSWYSCTMPTLPWVQDIVFISDTVGWAVLDDGYALLKTTDAGETWNVDSSFVPTKQVVSMYCANKDTIVLGSRSFVYTTTNAGATWKKDSLTTNFITQVAILDTYMGKRVVAISIDGTVAISDNMGESWEVQKLRQVFPKAFSQGFLASFTHDKHGKLWFCARNGFLATYDTLKNWNLITKLESTLTSITANKNTIDVSGLTTMGVVQKDFSYIPNSWCIDRADSLRIVGEVQRSNDVALVPILFKNSTNNLHISTNGGTTWRSIQKDTLSPVNDAVLLDDNTVLASFSEDYNGWVYRTTNQGLSWQLLETKIPYKIPLNLSFKENTILAYAQDAINVSTDKGMRWSVVPVPWGSDTTKIDNIVMQDATHWWAYGNFGLYYTSNSGTTWKEKNVSALSGQKIVSFATKNDHAWIVNFPYGELFESSDKGETWYKATLEYTRLHIAFYAVAVTDIGVIAVGNVGWMFSRNIPAPVSVSEENVESTGFDMYPNPAGSVVTLRCSNSLIAQLVRIDVVDYLGKQHQSIEVTSHGFDIDVSNVPQGMYAVVAYTKNGERIYRPFCISR